MGGDKALSDPTHNVIHHGTARNRKLLCVGYSPSVFAGRLPGLSEEGAVEGTYCGKSHSVTDSGYTHVAVGKQQAGL